MPLQDERALQPDVVGSKAASLARAARRGLPVLQGWVLPVEVIESRRTNPHDFHLALDQLWAAILETWGSPAVIVRSSSPVEDTENSSMAGRFESILDVGDPRSFEAAVEAVAESGESIGAAMAVLVQPMVKAKLGGVLFTADPVDGQTDRLLVAAVDEGPDALVSGRRGGVRYALSRQGRVLDVSGETDIKLGTSTRLKLVLLGRKVEEVYGGSQDIEWAIDERDVLRLLQARPITAQAPKVDKRSPIYGPGPLAETFPDALSPLESDLWLEPMTAALSQALVLAGVVDTKRLAKRPLTIAPGGRPAVDLALIGALPTRGLIARIDPRPGVRRLRASWRVGRLRAALPGLAKDILEQVDAELAAFPDPAELDHRSSLVALSRARHMLFSIHGYEILVGLLSEGDTTASSTAAVALRELAYGRAEGWSDPSIVARYPSVLALVPPRIGEISQLPQINGVPSRSVEPTNDDANASLREALRLRVRWVQELTVRISIELGRTLTSSGVLARPDEIRWLSLDELPAVIDGRLGLLDIGDRIPQVMVPPLPARFRVAMDGRIVTDRSRREGANTGVSVGRAEGRCVHDPGSIQAGEILVVRTLDPSLAAVLPRIAGLIAETGSPLSHLAILAREFGVPAVVNVEGALALYPPGTSVVIDGTTGEIGIVGESAA